MCELHGGLSNVRYFVTINSHLFTLLNVDFECVNTLLKKKKCICIYESTECWNDKIYSKYL